MLLGPLLHSCLHTVHYIYIRNKYKSPLPYENKYFIHIWNIERLEKNIYLYKGQGHEMDNFVEDLYNLISTFCTALSTVQCC